MQIEPAGMAEALSVRTDLTFGDGFRFGCGFLAAFVIFGLVLIIVVGVLAGLAFLVAPGLTQIFVH